MGFTWQEAEVVALDRQQGAWKTNSQHL